MDQQLKQRLIGAIIIVSLVVIFVPMLFEERQDDLSAAGSGEIPALPKEVEAKAIELPNSAADVAPSEESESTSTGYRIIPLTDGDSTAAESEQSASAESGEKPENRAASIADSEPTVADEDVLKATGDAQTSRAADPAESDKAQVAKTDEPAKAAGVSKSKQALARKSKLEPTTLTVNSEEGAVDTMPPDQPAALPKAKPKAPPAKPIEKGSKKSETTRAAESAKSASSPVSPQKPAQIKPSLDNSKAAPSEAVSKAPEIPSKPAVGGGGAKLPEPPIPAPEASDDLAAWVVQTGSFTTEGNARSLADKLRKSNFPAFVEVVNNAGTSVYRVQVGPELNRTRAEQIQKQIENTIGIKGIVVPHP
ncbi:MULTISPECIES: SPOR domain-containing protein [Methylocaldum]|jgi:DedD protein|uniref:SPOR domain-containing protein n=1 Tax=unclassified Methylocaldum TaxID=2622260 RepID=UPI00098A97E3|nr:MULTISPECIES: SPOR domain-containing protein [unclassified Methylocaldum]MBP1150483.1 DedD protein [Methylocaldum sp. RMAD-M]MVF23596.1 SPOR domain-containing protein [Methylocaldum sp. BRCS4]